MHILRRRTVVLLMTLWLVVGTACTRFDGEVSVHPDDTATVNFDISVPEDNADAREKVVAACRPTVQPKPEPYTKNGRIGCRVKGQLNQRKQVNAGFLVHTQDGRQTFQFGAMSASGDPARDELLKRFNELSTAGEFRLSVSFRGKVLSHSGNSTVEGRTVTWTNDVDLVDGLKAEAAEPGLLDRSVGEWIAIAVALLALAGFIGWVLRDIITRRAVQHRDPWGGPAYAAPRKRDRVG